MTRRTHVLEQVRGINASLLASSPADTVAFAYGIGPQVLLSQDGSDGRYFDLASLTKPLFTAATTLSLPATVLDIDAPASSVLGWLPTGWVDVTIRALLTHSAGLPSELPGEGGAQEIRGWIGALSKVTPPTVLYSDVNYWVLGELLTEVLGGTLDSLYATAPTVAEGEFAFGSAPAHATVAAGPVVGDRQLVHDPAARRLGLSGHAGAFGTLPGVVHAVMSWLDGSWLVGGAATEAFACQTHPIPGGHRSLAWTLAGDPFHVVAHDWPSTTLCHTGFTGVSVAVDPVSRWWAVYLSNAIPVDRDATPVLIARRHYHAAAAAHLHAVTGSNPAITYPEKDSSYA